MALSKGFSSGIDVAADMPLKGIAFLVTGVSIFSLQDVIIKSLSDGYPAHEIVFVRGLVAYRVAPPSLVAPFEYASLPWALLWGYLFWGDLPGPATFFGILLVVASGLYIIRRETVRGRRVVVGRPLRPRI